jgi:hypothetical protein
MEDLEYLGQNRKAVLEIKAHGRDDAGGVPGRLQDPAGGERNLQIIGEATHKLSLS